jgi:hypothetical protein
MNSTVDLIFFFNNPLNAELNPIYNLLALLGAHHILYISRVRVKCAFIELYRPHKVTV